MSHAAPTAALADRYRIERELGAGGMATVYLAEDVRHRRKVALKVLHPELSAVLGPERFLKEIELTANLQHPHILPLFDSGEAAGQLFYVMPFVEGETLRARLDREKQLPIADVLQLAREVADALQYAHDRGVIHRDIKPENILLHGGHALVADFGIALAVQQAGGARMTQTGLSLGTPQYMAPEQAMGEKVIDARADVYALGVVTYEMLAGEPPFTGPTAQAIIARVLTVAPAPLVETRSTVPAHVEEAVFTALAKLPADRWQTAREFVQALTGGPAAPRRQQVAPGSVRGRRSVLTMVLGGATVVATSLALWGWLARPAPNEAPVTRLRVVMTPGQEAAASGYPQHFALSSDGSRMAYVGVAPNDSTQLWVRERGSLDARPVGGTSGGTSPFFSPDAQSLAFVSPDGKLRKATLGGGDVVTLVDSMNPIAPGGTWLRDGTIVFSGLDWNLHRVGESGGTSTLVGDDSLSLLFPSALPRNDAVLATGCEAICNRMWIGVVDLKTRRFRKFHEDAVAGWYSPTGHIVFVRRNGAVFALPFNVNALEPRGAPIPLFDGVQVSAGITPYFALSADGTLLYTTGGGSGGTPASIVRVTRTGIVTPLDPSWPASVVGTPALSPDGKQIAVSVVRGQRSDIWTKQLDRGALTRLTAEGEGALNFSPSWLPDGTVGYVSSAGGWHLQYRRSDGTGAVSRIVVPSATSVSNPVWSADGKWVLFESLISGRNRIDALRLGTDSILPVVRSSSFDGVTPSLSPDGGWVAYASNESGRFEVYVRPFPDVARERHQISRQGGGSPAWSLDGRELYFVDEKGELMTAPLRLSSQLNAGEPKALFQTRGLLVNGGLRSFEPERGGRSFLMMRPETKTAPQLVMVLNWFRELRSRAGPR